MNDVEGWKNKRLIELAEYINGYAFKPDDWEKDGLPIIRIEQLKNPNAPTDYYSGKLPTKNIIENDDLIFSWSASLFLRIWRHDRAALNQHLFRVVEREGIDRVFLKLFIEFYLPELVKASHGSTMQHITRKELDRFGAPFPTSKPEQTKIAEILSTADRAIEQTEAIIAKQQRIKTGLMHDLLTRGIDEYGNLRSEQTHEFRDSPLGRIPVEWEVGTLSDIANINPKSDISQLSDNSLVTFLSMPDVGENGKIISRQIQKLSKVKTGFTRFTEQDILFAKITPCMENGKGTLATELINKIGFGSTEFHVLRANKSGNPEFIYHITQSKKFRLKSEGYMTGSAGQRRVPANFFQKFQIHLPPLSEQHHIAGILTAADQRVEKEEASRNKLLQIKTALMQDLLTGKKRVTPLLNDTEVVHG
ncbi:MAG: type I restriction enzyme, S subunit [Candidatus Argoarchaeum ethanivorans]|uniref:Type I restriction enzyme, S subunit n=1 Tax=Candidatus Argoarchaeum ethanivorans TaxID=2608793 RepID=A0A8B3S0Z4_9EURY|nr:MAG: type I restriction enzyme, S subunit [Candidatus Argoarchaeum ethanivorans]